MSEDLKLKRERVLNAASKAVDELILVLEEKIITKGEDDISADKMKNAASAKKLAFLDALEMLDKIELERNKTDETITKVIDTSSKGFAELAAEKKNGK
jgi:hypothetical protein